MFEQLLAKIGVALHNEGIPYMVIGGQAVLPSGEPRLTKDIEVGSEDFAYKWSLC